MIKNAELIAYKMIINAELIAYKMIINAELIAYKKAQLIAYNKELIKCI